MVINRVAELISNVTGIEENSISMEQSLEQLHVDEFALVDIMMDLESEFNIFVDDANTEIVTVSDIVHCFQPFDVRIQNDVSSRAQRTA